MALAKELNHLWNTVHNTAPAHVSSFMHKNERDSKNRFDRTKAVQVGDRLPDFALHDSDGRTWQQKDLLTSKGLLICFQRGGWCPFCNIELRSLQNALPQLHEKGVTLVAITPDSIEDTLSRKEKMQLDFLVLSDPENELVRRLGCLIDQPEEMRPFLETYEVWKTRKSLEIPVPATILVDGDGIVRETFVNPSYHERLEPTTALRWIEKLQS